MNHKRTPSGVFLWFQIFVVLTGFECDAKWKTQAYLSIYTLMLHSFKSGTDLHDQKSQLREVGFDDSFI